MSIPGNRYAVGALVSGVVGTLMALLLMGWLGILAVYLGRKGQKAFANSEDNESGARMAKAGEILGWVAIGLTLLLIAGYSGTDRGY
jgi:hypothetical protein